MPMTVTGDQIQVTFSNKMFGFQMIGGGVVLGAIMYFIAGLIGAIVSFVLMLAVGIFFVMKPDEIIEFKPTGIEISDKEGNVMKSHQPDSLRNVRVTTTNSNNRMTGYVVHIDFVDDKLKLKGGALGGISNMENTLNTIFGYMDQHYGFKVQLGEQTKGSLKDMI